jgi:hypothetical protein
MPPSAFCFADVTELRDDSVIPEWSQRQLRSVTGLEAATGGDWIVSGLESMPDTIRTPLAKPVERLLLRHFDLPVVESAGSAILIQRKSGADFVGSIDKLNNIQERMMQWARPGGCRLLITGVWPTEDGRVATKGHTFDRTFDSLLKKLAWWEVRGGHVDWLTSDSEIDEYLRNMMDMVSTIMDTPIRYTSNLEPFVHRPPVQGLLHVSPDWLITGSAFPMGWGVKKRQAVYDSLVADKLEPTLNNALARVLIGKVKIKGIGPKLRDSLREWVGSDGESLVSMVHTKQRMERKNYDRETET